MQSDQGVMKNELKIVVTVATYQRAAMLRQLLDGLSAMVIPEGVVASLVIVDNDAAGSARAVVDSARVTHPLPIHYAIEPERNIALARNRGVAMALAAGAGFVAFIDDDEVPDRHWLDQLFRTIGTTGAGVATGPVLARLDAAVTPSWAREFDPFTRHRHIPSGTEVPTAETANALVAGSLFREIDPPFDPAFGRTGGSDSLFFLHVRRAGARIVWANDAIVRETIPAARARIGWLAQRAFRVGNCGVFVERAALPLRTWAPIRLAKTVAHFVVGLASLITAPLAGRSAALGALRHLCLACGALSAFCGFRYFEYGTERMVGT